MMGPAMASAIDEAHGDSPTQQTTDWSVLINKSRKSKEGSSWGGMAIGLGSLVFVLLVITFALSAATAAHVLSDGVDDTCVDEMASWTYYEVDLASPPINLVLVLDGGMHHAFAGYVVGVAEPCMERLHLALAARGLWLYATENATRSVDATVPRMGVCHHPPCMVEVRM